MINCEPEIGYLLLKCRYLLMLPPTGDFTVKRVDDFRIFLKPARRNGALASTVCGKLHVQKLGHHNKNKQT